MVLNTRDALMFTYIHLPQKINYLSYPPKDITKDKFNDINYLEFCIEEVNRLNDEDFCTREDGVHPYTKDIMLMHLTNRIKELSSNKKTTQEVKDE